MGFGGPQSLLLWTPDGTLNDSVPLIKVQCPIAREIAANVGHRLSNGHQNLRRSASQMSIFGFEAPVDTITRLSPLNIFMLLFSLTIAGSAAGAPDEAHDWVLRRLQKVGSITGIQRAVDFAG